MVTTPCITSSCPSRAAVPAALYGDAVLRLDRMRSFGSVGNARTAWTGEFCGTTVPETIGSIQVTANKPHPVPGTSPGVLT